MEEVLGSPVSRAEAVSLEASGEKERCSRRSTHRASVAEQRSEVARYWESEADRRWAWLRVRARLEDEAERSGRSQLCGIRDAEASVLRPCWRQGIKNGAKSSLGNEVSKVRPHFREGLMLVKFIFPDFFACECSLFGHSIEILTHRSHG